MKKIIIALFCILFLSCKGNDEERILIYKQLIEYRDELKMNSKEMDYLIHTQAQKDKYYKRLIGNQREILVEYEKAFEKLKFKERNAIIKLRDSFNTEREHPLFLHFDTSDYKNVSDTVFNRLMEIDFYKSKRRFQDMYLLKRRDPI
ncbi:hypothetical protein [Flavobacterium humi]|uniref:Uncharacterized protein n=1 Tax=Flavobacterium humi TaxID=2562683 RepID=A0A4Z0LD23_9FLAO|nr:hypothetical protein [Flavobacterium humi]TGD59802.1 hypothetical protein E4635_02410 [Flavobacterium humi]